MCDSLDSLIHFSLRSDMLLLLLDTMLSLSLFLFNYLDLSLELKLSAEITDLFIFFYILFYFSSCLSSLIFKYFKTLLLNYEV